jgi:hypothetical protein
VDVSDVETGNFGKLSGSRRHLSSGNSVQMVYSRSSFRRGPGRQVSVTRYRSLSLFVRTELLFGDELMAQLSTPPHLTTTLQWSSTPLLRLGR